MLRVFFFDLDDTLYASATGLWPAIGQRINRYLIERMRLDPADALALRQHYMETYGTTLNGLRHDYGIDAEDYLAFVHDLPLDDYLEPSPALGQMLGQLSLRKVIFTNADELHARRVLGRLGVAEHFESIIDVHAMDFVNKPDPRAYAAALALTGVQANESLFIDDTVRNLRPAHELGMLAVLVGAAGGPAPEGVDYQIDSILELGGLWARLHPDLKRGWAPVTEQRKAQP